MSQAPPALMPRTPATGAPGMLARMFCFVILCVLMGCSTRSSSFAPLPVVDKENVPMHQEGLPKAQNGCGWVVVNEKTITHVLGIRLKTDVRQFERSLFYCCPGDNKPNPKCYQADWFYRSDK